MAGFARTRLLMALGLSVMVTASTACGFGGTGATMAKPATTGQTAPGQTAAGPQASQASASKPASSAVHTEKAEKVDPCSLTTAAEVEGIVGKLRSGPEPLKGQDGSILQCKFVTSNGSLVNLAVIDAVNWELHKGLAENEEGSQKVPGLGEDGFFRSGKGATPMLEILKRPYILQVNVTMDDEDALTFSKAVAEKALPRL